MAGLGVIVTARSGYDLGYAWKKPRSGWRQARRTSPGGVLHRSCARRRAARTVVGGQARNARFQMDGGRHDAVYKQIQPGTGKGSADARGNYARFEDHHARFLAAKPTRRQSAGWNWNARQRKPPA